MTTSRQRIQLRRDTAAAWTAANPVLAAGEPGIETDTGRMKIGNGAAAWALLPYSGGGLNVNDTAKVDKSIVYYSASEDAFKADPTWTTISLTDGGNF
jgi:hypothetical protein